MMSASFPEAAAGYREGPRVILFTVAALTLSTLQTFRVSPESMDSEVPRVGSEANSQGSEGSVRPRVATDRLFHPLFRQKKHKAISLFAEDLPPVTRGAFCFGRLPSEGGFLCLMKQLQLSVLGDVMVT